MNEQERQRVVAREMIYGRARELAASGRYHDSDAVELALKVIGYREIRLTHADAAELDDLCANARRNLHTARIKRKLRSQRSAG